MKKVNGASLVFLKKVKNIFLQDLSLFEILAFLSLLLFAIVFRAQELISKNSIFLIDQGRDFLAVRDIVFDHHFTLIGPYTSLQGVFQGPLYYYLLSIPTLIFRGDPWGGLLLMFILSILTLILSFFWLKRLFSIKVAFVGLILLAISPEAITSATYVWNPHPMWVLLVVYTLSFFEIISKNRKFLYIFWPTVMLMFHFQAALGFFILLSSILYFVIFERSKIRKDFLLSFLLSLLLFLPTILFELRHNFLMTNSLVALLTGEGRGLLASGEETTLLKRVVGNMYGLYGNLRSSFPNFFILNLIAKVIPFLLIVSLFFSRRMSFLSEPEKNFVNFLGRLSLIIVFLYLLYPFPVRYWHLTGFQVIYIFFFSIFLSKLLYNKIGKVTFLLLSALILTYSVQRIGEIYTEDLTEGGVAKIKGKIEVIDFIYNDARGLPFNLLIFTPPVNTDAYDYLVWWYGMEKYGYIPGKEKKEIFYLLIEPDPEKPWSYKGWLETVIKDGKIVKTYNHPKGFVIQKRYL